MSARAFFVARDFISLLLTHAHAATQTHARARAFSRHTHTHTQTPRPTPPLSCMFLFFFSACACVLLLCSAPRRRAPAAESCGTQPASPLPTLCLSLCWMIAIPPSVGPFKKIHACVLSISLPPSLPLLFLARSLARSHYSLSASLSLLRSLFASINKI